MTPISDLELANVELAARALAEADGALDRDVSTASTGGYLLASRHLERLVTAGFLLSLVREVREHRRLGTALDKAAVAARREGRP